MLDFIIALKFHVDQDFLVRPDKHDKLNLEAKHPVSTSETSERYHGHASTHEHARGHLMVPISPVLRAEFSSQCHLVVPAKTLLWYNLIPV